MSAIIGIGGSRPRSDTTPATNKQGDGLGSGLQEYKAVGSTLGETLKKSGNDLLTGETRTSACFGLAKGEERRF